MHSNVTFSRDNRGRYLEGEQPPITYHILYERPAN